MKEPTPEKIDFIISQPDGGDIVKVRQAMLDEVCAKDELGCPPCVCPEPQVKVVEMCGDKPAKKLFWNFWWIK